MIQTDPEKRFDDLLKQMVQGEPPSEEKKRRKAEKQKPEPQPE